MTERAGMWERVGSRMAGHFAAFDVREDELRSPRDGSLHTFHVVALPRCALVVAETEDGRFVLVEQHRHGAGERVLEFPAGRLDPGETDIDGGLRELREETGYTAAQARLLSEIWAEPTTLTNTTAVIAAWGCACDGPQHLDETEDVTVRTFSARELDAMVADGTIRSGQTIAAWLLYRLASSPAGGSV